MAFADYLNNKNKGTGYATPQTPAQIQGIAPTTTTSGGGFGSYLKQKTQPVQTTQPVEQPYTGPVEEVSPLSWWQRFKLSLAEENDEGQKYALKNLGFEPLQTAKGEIVVRKGDKVYKVDEVDKTLKDAADLFGGALPMGGALVGGAAGSYVAPGAGTYAGGGIGAGIGETIRETLGKGLGVREDLSAKEIGLQTIGGTLGMAGAGKGAQILGKAIR